MWTRFLLLFLGCLTNTYHVSLSCPMPTEDKPISVCAFCSESYAGVKWMVHEGSINSYPFGAYSLNLRFECSTSQNTIKKDECFNGNRFPGLIFLHNPNIWRWHIIGQSLSEGTECIFTANVKDGYHRDLIQVSSSCMVESAEKSLNMDLIMPAKCTDTTVDQSACQCHCNNGFESDDDISDQILTCKNINECADGTHHCRDYSDCTDTEGAYTCASDSDIARDLQDSKKESEVPPSDVTIEPTATSALSITPTSASNTTAFEHTFVLLASPTPRHSTPFPETTTSEDKDTPICTTTTSTTTSCTITTSTSVCCY